MLPLLSFFLGLLSLPIFLVFLITNSLFSLYSIPLMVVAVIIYYYLITRKRWLVLIPALLGNVFLQYISGRYSPHTYINMWSFVNFFSILWIILFPVLIAGTFQVIATKRQWKILKQLLFALISLLLVLGVEFAIHYNFIHSASYGSGPCSIFSSCIGSGLD